MKKNSISYPLTVIEIENYSKICPKDVLNKFDQNEYGIVDEEKTLLFADANDRVKLFDLTKSKVTILNRSLNLSTYSEANKVYKMLLNARTWIIHGCISYCMAQRRSEEQGNFLLVLNATELYIKNQILNGLRRLLDSFLTNKKFTFEVLIETPQIDFNSFANIMGFNFIFSKKIKTKKINFDEILKACFKRKFEIQYFLKINASKFKTNKCNLIISTTPSTSDPLHLSAKKSVSIFQRFRNAFSHTITTAASSFKFTLNSLPYLCFQYETKNTCTFFVKNEDKLLKILKNSPSSLSPSSKPLGFVNMASNDFIQKNSCTSVSKSSESSTCSSSLNQRKVSTCTLDSCASSKQSATSPLKTTVKSEKIARSNRLSRQILLLNQDISQSDESLVHERSSKRSSITISYKKKLNVLKECMRSSEEHIYEDISQTTAVTKNGSIETNDFIFLNTNAFRKQDYYLPKSYSFTDLHEDNLETMSTNTHNVQSIGQVIISPKHTKSIIQRHAKLFTSESHLF